MKKKSKRLKTIPKKHGIAAMIIIIVIISFVMFMWILENMKNSKVEAVSPEIAESAQNTEENVITVGISEESEESVDNLPKENSQVSEKEKQQIKANKNTPTYYIKVNYTANVVTIYTKDNNGEYTVPYKAMVCSTGTATPRSGVYKMSGKYRWLSLFGGVNGQYCSRITGNILFHSVPYLTKSPDSLEYWEYDKLGSAASAGCIRLTVVDTKWIYDNCLNGTYVEFYSSSDPGPLGKPSSRKISSNEQCRNWDPTDAVSGNPWNSYVPPQSNNKLEEKKNPPKEEPSKPEGNQSNQEEQNKKDENKDSTQNETKPPKIDESNKEEKTNEQVNT